MFNRYFDEMANVAADARARHLKCFIGGDFNTELYRGWRGERLHEFAAAYGLQICNDPDRMNPSLSWTFESSFGCRRTLDYILIDEDLIATDARVIDGLSLGSDHRAVQVCVPLPIRRNSVPRRTFMHRKTDWSLFGTIVHDQLSYRNVNGLHDLEDVMMESSAHLPRPTQRKRSGRDSPSLRVLRAERRVTADRQERCRLSKLIWRLTRQALRSWRTQQICETLKRFEHLKDLERAHMYPVRRVRGQQPDFVKCAEMLAAVYSSDSASNLPTPMSCAIPPITGAEIGAAVRRMATHRCADKRGLVLEMFLHAGDVAHEYLANCFNQMLQTRTFPTEWYDTYFTLLHKGGQADDPNNWRPIAILSIAYKIFSRVVFSRLQAGLDVQQADDQFGFRPHRSVDHALLILESVVGKCVEWNLPIYIVSVDLRKAFDRVEHVALFAALSRMGVQSEYINLLQLLYQRMQGVVGSEPRFPIKRGVRQGDVLSPTLFNTVLEDALRKWKHRLTGHGISIVRDAAEPRLTNIRYADDLLIFGKSKAEAIEMLELLVVVLAEYGLSLNAGKTRMLTTDTAPEIETYCDTACGRIQLLHRTGTHKYLGRCLVGDLFDRGRPAVDHRISCAWGKFKALQKTLVNKHVDVGLRLRLFESVVTPAALYSLSTAPMTEYSLSRLDTTQRKMLRRIIGWINFSDESWEQRGRRMKTRLANALELHPVSKWSQSVRERKRKILATKSSLPQIVQKALDWDPKACAFLNLQTPFRCAGRPRTRWYENV